MTNTNLQLKIQHSPFTIFSILALSLVLNLHALAADSFWGDEILTAMFANQTPAEVIHGTANDIHPPLYYLLAGIFTRLTVPLGSTDTPNPVSDWLWRFPSVIAGVLTIAITYRLAFYVSRSTLHAPRSTSHKPRTIATSAALLLALAPVAIKYGQEARMHALFMCLSALSTWLFFRAVAQPRRWPRWLAYTLVTTANIYTMYFGLLILAAQTGFLIFTILDLRYTRRRRDNQSSIVNLKSKIVGFTATTVLVFILYLPWWPVLFSILRERAAVGAIEGGVGNPLEFLRGFVQALGPLPEPVAWGFLFLFFTGLIFLARPHWPLAGFAGLWLVLPVTLPIFLGDPRALQFRYAFVLPVYLIVVTYAIVKIGRLIVENRQIGKSTNRQIGKLANWQIGELAKQRNRQATSQQTSHPAIHQTNLSIYLIWILATLSFIATLGVYRQIKPDWRGAAAYLDEHTAPADIILIGPLWDEGRFIDYYYRGQAQLLTPAAMVTNIERRVESLRTGGGRVWAVNRFVPAESPVMQHHIFPGVVVSEPALPVYEPALLTDAAIDLAAQAVEFAYPWAAEAQAQGVLDPDPRTAQAAALRALGDTLVAAGRPQEALQPYQTAVDIFPGWVNGFIALAETQELVGNLPAAAAAYRQAVAFNLKWHGPPAVEAETLVNTGQWSAAIQKYHQIIEAR